MSSLPLISSSLLPLQQPGLVASLTSRWAPHVRFVFHPGFATRSAPRLCSPVATPTAEAATAATDYQANLGLLWSAPCSVVMLVDRRRLEGNVARTHARGLEQEAGGERCPPARALGGAD